MKRFSTKAQDELREEGRRFKEQLKIKQVEEDQYQIDLDKYEKREVTNRYYEEKIDILLDGLMSNKSGWLKMHFIESIILPLGMLLWIITIAFPAFLIFTPWISVTTKVILSIVMVVNIYWGLRKKRLELIMIVYGYIIKLFLSTLFLFIVGSVVYFMVDMILKL